MNTSTRTVKRCVGCGRPVWAPLADTGLDYCTGRGRHGFPYAGPIQTIEVPRWEPPRYFDSTPSTRFRPEPDDDVPCHLDRWYSDVEGRCIHTDHDPVVYVSVGPCSTHRIVGCPCVGPIAAND